MANKFIAAIFAAALPMVAAPLVVSAQDAPPPYAAPDAAVHDQQIRGRIEAFDGQFNLQVRDENGYIDNVELHQGTIINPTGLTLEPGMVVSILGYNGGGAFDANEIDTPYQYDSGVAYYQGHPWSYFGPSVSLGFFFGNVGWWQPHYSAFFGGRPFVEGYGYGPYYARPGYYGRVGYYGHDGYYGRPGYVQPGYSGGVRASVNVNVDNTYRSGSPYRSGPYNNGTGYRGAAPNGGSYRTTTSYRGSAPTTSYRGSAPTTRTYGNGGNGGGNGGSRSTESHGGGSYHGGGDHR